MGIGIKENYYCEGIKIMVGLDIGQRFDPQIFTAETGSGNICGTTKVAGSDFFGGRTNTAIRLVPKLGGCTIRAEVEGNYLKLNFDEYPTKLSVPIKW